MSGETIVITRPKGDGEMLAEALQERGYRVIHEPLSEIVLLHNERQRLEHALRAEPDAIIVTSRHAAQALALLTEWRDAYLLCVGEATAQAAASLGFTRTAAAGGNVDSLLEFIAQGYDAGSRFLYASGRHVSADIIAELSVHGMEVEHLVLYDAVAATQLSDTLTEQLKRGQIDGVTFMSPRAAQIFTALLAEAEMSAADLQAFCLSEAITEPLKGWKAVHVARHATLASLVDGVDNVFHGR